MAVCSHCGTALNCPDHGAHLIEGVAETCPLNKNGVIWVEVVDDKGAPVDGVNVEVAAAERTTKGGFAQSDPVPVGSAYTAKVKAPLPDSHKDTHALPLSVDLKGIPVQNGQIKLVSFKLRAIVKPLIEVAKKVVAVGGPKQPVALKADRAFSGKGTLTIVAGGDKVKDDRRQGHARHLRQVRRGACARRKEGRRPRRHPAERRQVTQARQAHREVRAGRICRHLGAVPHHQ
jgi:hypothetical protein